MRRLILAAAALLLLAAPAAAQDSRDASLRLELETARQRDIDQSNQLMALDAQLRADQAIRQTEAQRIRPILPAPPAPRANVPATAAPVFTDIPDDRLAASNARVKAAAERRR